MTSANMSRYLQTKNMIIPEEGPVIVPTELDFSADALITIETEALFSSGKVSLLQGVFIDNYDNNAPLVMVNQISRQRVVCPANSQGYFDVFVPKPSTFNVTTTPVADLAVKIHFYNVPIASGVWPMGSGAAAGGSNTFTDLSLELDGTSQSVDGSAAGGKLLVQNPTGNATVTVNLANGDATLGGIELAGGGSLVLDGGVATDFTVAGTNGETLIIYGGV